MKLFYKAVPDGSVSNIRSLIHLVILQLLGDTTFFKRTVQTDRQTHRAYKWLQVLPFNLTVNVGNDKLRFWQLPWAWHTIMYDLLWYGHCASLYWNDQNLCGRPVWDDIVELLRPGPNANIEFSYTSGILCAYIILASNEV